MWGASSGQTIAFVANTGLKQASDLGSQAIKVIVDEVCTVLGTPGSRIAPARA